MTPCCEYFTSQPPRRNGSVGSLYAMGNATRDAAALNRSPNPSFSSATGAPGAAVASNCEQPGLLLHLTVCLQCSARPVILTRLIVVSLSGLVVWLLAFASVLSYHSHLFSPAAAPGTPTKGHSPYKPRHKRFGSFLGLEYDADEPLIKGMPASSDNAAAMGGRDLFNGGADAAARLRAKAPEKEKDAEDEEVR